MSSDATATQATTFRPERTHIYAVIAMMGIAVMGIAWAPLILGWLLIIPLVFIFWVFRAQTVVDESGIHITYAFRSNETLRWEDFAGIGFVRSRAFASTTDDRRLNLPGVRFNSLPRLEKASNGRIPDALTAARRSGEDKIVVTHRDGQRVMMSREEFEAYDGVAAQHYESHPAAQQTPRPDSEGDSQSPHHNR